MGLPSGKVDPDAGPAPVPDLEGDLPIVHVEPVGAGAEAVLHPAAGVGDQADRVLVGALETNLGEAHTPIVASCGTEGQLQAALAGHGMSMAALRRGLYATETCMGLRPGPTGWVIK